jgi:AcrR family transcriptional regulator
VTPGQRAVSYQAARAERAEATRAALLTAARRLFVEKGYFATGTEEIVAASGVGTRGALYHHFADKRAVFLAVFEIVEQDMLNTAASGEAPTDGLGRLRFGLMGFLQAALTPEVQRIILIDGPAVLGWQQWRAMEQQYGLGAFQALLGQAVAEGALPEGQSTDALAHVLLAAVDEAALFIANADDQIAARDQAVDAVNRLLAGLALTAR